MKIRTIKQYQHRDNDNDKNVQNNVTRDNDNNKARTYATLEDNLLNKRGWARLIRIGKDKYNRLIIKAKDTMNKLKKIEEKGVCKNAAPEWNRLIKELQEIDLQLELEHRIQER